MTQMTQMTIFQRTLHEASKPPNSASLHDSQNSGISLSCQVGDQIFAGKAGRLAHDARFPPFASSRGGLTSGTCNFP